MPIFAETKETRAWRSYAQSLDAPHRPVILPSGDDLLETLEYLEIPTEDLPNVVASAPQPDADPELWWYLERAVWSLVSRMGSLEQPPRFPALRDINDPDHRFFYIHVFVAALPYVREYHRCLGIPDGIAQATLADLGRNVRVHRKREGLGGLGVAWWLMLHFRGVIYQLGRLQFEHVRLPEKVSVSIRDVSGDFGIETRGLSIHIPDFSGPMTPEACDDSIRRARNFFPRYFPEDNIRYALCSSWLLDPQLKQYLKPDSNIIRFQDRFHLVEGVWESNLGVMQFVFGRTPEQIASVPRETSLQKAVVTHIENGGNWYARTGWLELDESESRT